ncbi:MAG TPA: energy-coupling factor transporter transmembrane component T [Candidatus Cloacimonadota bacterium]|nr:energy-coupling factor transporter transmembrane component T [Candidatus Cloacimonadales bacterium]HPY97113.1 energy-coupling factor transporter transmembrane component T [Candidatus Cloacimonadota bacterium]HQB41140.1 energy-coupling factor transporter transmembrane component T [Candidatus Cloacimonadota bacterium]
MLSKKLDPRTLIFACIISTSLILFNSSLIKQFCVFSLLLIFAVLMRFIKKSVGKVLYKMRHLIFTLFVMQLLFRHGGETYYQFSFIKITEAGVQYSLSSFLRYATIILSSIVLINVSLNEFLEVFQYYKLPRNLSLTVTFCIQYLTSFSRQIKHINQIIKQRNMLKNSRFKQKMLILKEVSLPLVVKSLSEVQYKAIALELKGVSLKPQFKTNLKFYLVDYLIILLFISANVLVILY